MRPAPWEALRRAERHAPEVRERYIEPLERQMAKEKSRAVDE